MTVHPAKTQISLGSRPVWSESLLCAYWVAKDLSFLHADSEVSDQTGQMPRLIRVFAGGTAILLVLSCHGSFLPDLSSSCIIKLYVSTFLQSHKNLLDSMFFSTPRVPGGPFTIILCFLYTITEQIESSNIINKTGRWIPSSRIYQGPKNQPNKGISKLF